MIAVGEALCYFCQQPVNVSLSTTRRLRTGWYRERAKGEHGLELAENLNTWACGSCVERRKLGLPVEQGALAL